MIYTNLPIPVAEVHQRLLAGELPRLWIPATDNYCQVDAIPILGTGKVDLRGLRELAGSGSGTEFRLESEL